MARLHDVLTTVCRGAAALCALAMIAIVAASIVLREVFSIPLVWANEISIVLFVWTVFLGAGVAFSDNAHIRFGMLVDALPLRERRIAALVTSYVGLVLLAGLVATGAYVAWIYRNQTLTTVATTAAWQWTAVPVGALMATIGWARHGHWTWGSTRRIVDAKDTGLAG
ncbi:MAG: TRAP transporter small permease [Proteobacteria bacterium]|nr:TRAP transporter small permease [Pseudomonadota bacterium]